MVQWQEADVRFMRRALALARRGQGRVEPNPMVGCVIVRGGRIIAQGYHRRFGAAHAEIEALQRARRSCRGATVYVTLEPCCHHGKTGPCTDALIAAGVGRVVAAMPDPFPAVAGKGLAQLRRAGIRVQVGLCEQEARRLNAPYLKLRTTARPWVILKWAQSLDGKIATRTGQSRWITCPEARREAHRLRGRMDAILVGSNTVRMDDPLLTCRDARCTRVAARVVVASQLSLEPRAQVVRTARTVPTIVATTRQAVQRRGRLAERLRHAGCELLALPAVAGRVSLDALLDELGRRDMTNVMVEGGGTLLGAFFDQALADEAVVFVSPKLIGGADAPGPLGRMGIHRLSEAVAPREPLQRRWVGPDMMYRLLLTDPRSFTGRAAPKRRRE